MQSEGDVNMIPKASSTFTCNGALAVLELNTIMGVPFTLEGAGHVDEVGPLQGTLPARGRQRHQLRREGPANTLHQINQRGVRCRKVTWTKEGEDQKNSGGEKNES